MTATPVAALSQQHGDFFVPAFELRIEQSGLPRDVLRDVIRFSYHDDVESIDSFEITVNNWDDTTGRFKYVGSETEADLRGSGDDSLRYRLFEPCNKTVQVFMGYAGHLVLMMTGTFTTMEPRFTDGQAPTLTVRGLNVLHQLRRKQYTHAWSRMKESDIAANIATLTDNGQRRFPLPIRIDREAASHEEAVEYVAQDNQYDIDFLFQRARRLGYVVHIEEDEQGRRLYFGPSQSRTQPIEVELTWGQSLCEFTPTLTTANQIRSVTVKGWDRARQREISETVSLDDPRIQINRDLHELLLRCDPREEQVVHEPVFTRRQARERAINLLQDRNRELIKCSGTTVGIPDLVAGRRIQIRGVGARFSGTYFVTETTHTIEDNGYQTQFRARREDRGEGGRS